MEWPGHRHPEGSAWQRGLRMAVGVEGEEENVFARREVRGAGGTSINGNDNGGGTVEGRECLQRTSARYRRRQKASEFAEADR
jgi:hypothetical protein